MKIISGIILTVVFTFFLFPTICKAQSEEAEQLLLNYQKLTALKKILQNMYEGYQNIEQGYLIIRDLSRGNFDLHQTFLDGLQQVSPVVKKYKGVVEIISKQKLIYNHCKVVMIQYRQAGIFLAEEIRYLEKVYGQQLKELTENLDGLIIILTSSKLRMSDDERMSAIDRILSRVEDQLVFCLGFSESNNILALQRRKDHENVGIARKLYGLK